MGVDRFDRCRTKPLSGSADGFDSNICQFWESFLKDQVLEEGNHGNLSSSNMPASSSLPSSYGCHGNSSLSFRAILHFLLSRSPLPSFLMRNGAGRGRAAERAAAAEKKKRGRSEVLRRVGAGGRKQCHRPSLPTLSCSKAAGAPPFPSLPRPTRPCTAFLSESESRSDNNVAEAAAFIRLTDIRIRR